MLCAQSGDSACFGAGDSGSGVGNMSHPCGCGCSGSGINTEQAAQLAVVFQGFFCDN